MVRAGVFPVTGDSLSESQADAIADFLNEVMVGNFPVDDHVKISIEITSKFKDTYQFGISSEELSAS